MKINKILFLFCFIQQIIIAQQSLPQQINNLLQQQDMQGAQVGLVIYDLSANKEVYNLNGNQSIIPASTQKLITTATALKILGENHTFKTQIKYSGDLDSNKNLKGNLYIIGGGDPTFESRYFEDAFGLEDLCNIISSKINKIEGDVIAVNNYFLNKNLPDEWIWGDFGNYYGAYPEALNISDNRMDLYFKSSDPGNPTQIIKKDPFVPGVEFKNEVLSSEVNKDLAYVYGIPQQKYRYVTGTIPANKNSFKVKASLAHPSLSFAALTYNLLSERNVRISGFYKEIEKTNNLKLKDLHTYESPTVSEIVKWVNMKSVNLFAEALKLELEVQTNENPLEYIVEFWDSLNLRTQGVFLHDGSGLARYNSITPNFLIDILKTMQENKSFNASLPIAKKSGSLKYMFKKYDVTGKIQAKSGYMERVRSYAGYVNHSSGKRLAFALIINNYSYSASEMKREMEKIMASIVEMKVEK